MAREWCRRVCRPTARRAIAALLLVLGMLSIPVNCALAAGPHSIFVPATEIALHLHAAHLHHVEPTPPGDGVRDFSRGMHDPQRPAQNVPAADSLPTPAPALTVLAAVTSDDTSAALPVAEAVLPMEQAAPSAWHARLDVPPPRV